ncbi:MAG: hypothetical protein JO243_17995 [Solirubrobacterales bacterium]|nr:hypothetical protein [Solirubrobacterales bacterium]
MRWLVICRRWVWALAAALVAVVLAALAIETAAGRPLAAPARLAALDPGGRLGANTIVAGATGGVVYAVPRRANFILALGPRSRCGPAVSPAIRSARSGPMSRSAWGAERP